MGIDVEILDLARTLIETFGNTAPKHARQLATSLKAANRDRAMRYEIAAEVAAQLLKNARDDKKADKKADAAPTKA